MNFSFKNISCVIFAIISLCYCGTKTKTFEPEVKPKPNIIFFLVDDLGWSDLGFRDKTFETPNIDKLATAGINFTQFYIASPTCSPSRSSILTGKHPARLKIVRHIPTGTKYGFDEFGRTTEEFNYLDRDPAQFPCRNWLPLEHSTYAEFLKEQGYYNLFIGKWHLGHEEYHPTQQGFDKQIGTANAGHPSSYYPPYFKDSTLFPDANNRYLTDKLTDEAVDFIENYDKDQPFNLSFWYYSVHHPHEGRTDLLEHFKSRGLEGRYANYAAMVKTADESIGRVLEAIKNKGIEKETIVIFMSDQGGYFENKPFRGGKLTETLCEGGARVPFFFYWPGVTKASTENNSIVQSVDLFPTLVDLLGGDISNYKDIDGVSLLPSITENKQVERDAIYGYRAYEDLYASVRSGDWKLLAYRSGKLELYNITNDIKEERDLVDKKPEKRNELVEKLRNWEKEMEVEEYSGVQ